MDGSRFDDLTRALAGRSSRRRVLAVLAGAVAGASLAGRGAAAAPRCKRVDQVCHTTADCCPNENGTYCAGTKKMTCQPCAGAICGGQCVAGCAGGQVLDPATCACGCPAGTRNCGGTCTAITEANCEDCGQACPAGAVCTSTGTDGTCSCPLQNPTYCPGSGACTNLLSDPANCGSCGNACDADAFETCGGDGTPGVCGRDIAGTCNPGSDYCVGTSDSAVCNANPDCACATTTEGGTACAQLVPIAYVCGDCTTSADCGPGMFCLLTTSDLGCDCSIGTGRCEELCPPLSVA